MEQTFDNDQSHVVVAPALYVGVLGAAQVNAFEALSLPSVFSEIFESTSAGLVPALGIFPKVSGVPPFVSQVVQVNVLPALRSPPPLSGAVVLIVSVLGTSVPFGNVTVSLSAANPTVAA